MIETQVNLTDRVTEIHKTALAFDKGDHWQDGKAFLPFVSLKANTELAEQMKASLETENIIAEVLDNEQNGLLGREPDWQVVAENENQQELSADIEKSIVSYWNDFNLIDKLKQSNRLSGSQEKAVIRAFVPKGLLNNPKTTLDEAMRLIRFEVLAADQAGVFLDEETHQYYGLHKKQTKDGKTLTELTYLENGKTVVKIIERSNYATLANETLASLKNYMPADKESSDEAVYDLGGELLYFELNRKPLITESIISNQKDVNLCLTLKNRLSFQAAYRDFIATNAQPPVDAEGKPAKLKIGGNQVNFLAGEPLYEDDNKTIKAYANPSFNIIDPASSENIVKSKDASAVAIYNQVSQIHLTKNDSVNASGASKRESRFSFEKKLNGLKQTIDPAGRWMLKVLTRFAADILGRENEFAQLRFDFNCRIDAGTPDPEEIRQASEDVKNGLLSEETYLSKYLRFDDADAEKARLEASGTHQSTEWLRKFTLAKEAKATGLPAEFIVDQILKVEDEAERTAFLTALNTVQAEPALTASV